MSFEVQTSDHGVREERASVGGGPLDRLREADRMIRAGSADEDVERLAGVTLSEILGLRALAAVRWR